MNNKEEVLEKLAKIKALADKGVGGEKENAQALLDRLMKEHGITEQDIAEDKIIAHEFWYEKNIPFTERLLAQVVYSVVGNIDSEKGLRSYIHNTKGRSCIRCTATEYLEIVAKYEFYVYHLAKDMRVMYDAFLNVNNIYPDPSKVKSLKDYDDMTPEERERRQKAAAMAFGMEEHKFHRQIEGGRK